MLKPMIAFAGASLLILSGCQGPSSVKAEAPAAVEVKQALSPEATQALAKAEADVKGAKAQKALWSTAADALKKAKEAAEKFDNATVIKQAKVASEHAQLGIEQTKYPLAK